MPKNSLLSFFHTLEKLKTTPRTGWIERGVQHPESISDHSFRMTILALALAPKLKCDTNKLVQLCLVHDLHESVCGDLILDYGRFGGAFKGVSPDEKKRREKKAMHQLFCLLDPATKKRFQRLWNEFETQKTREAKIAKQLDVLEMLFQAFEYEKAKNYRKPVFEAFYESNHSKIKNLQLSHLLDELKTGSIKSKKRPKQSKHRKKQF